MAGPSARPPANLSSVHEGTELNRQEAADYIAAMLESLGRVANGARMPFLAYLIDVAREEAKNEKTTETN
jgi:nitrate reductase assembly molybdenum cofactor insertion protein NarJ